MGAPLICDRVAVRPSVVCRHGSGARSPFLWPRACPRSGCGPIVQEAAREVVRAGLGRWVRRVVVLGDGAEWIWKQAWAQLALPGVEVLEILDFYHAGEHLAQAATAVYGGQSEVGTAPSSPPVPGPDRPGCARPPGGAPLAPALQSAPSPAAAPVPLRLPLPQSGRYDPTVPSLPFRLPAPRPPQSPDHKSAVRPAMASSLTRPIAHAILQALFHYHGSR